MTRTILALVAALALPAPALADATTDLQNAVGTLTAAPKPTSSLLTTPALDAALSAATDAGGAYCPGSVVPYHGRAGSRYTITSLGVTVGWIQIEQEYWCWTGYISGQPHSGKIVGWGKATATKSAFPGYCWDNYSYGDGWWSPWWERRAFVSGSLGLFHGSTCIGVRSAGARLYYQTGGRWNIG